MDKMFFADIPQIKYEGPESNNPFSFKFYNPKRIINGKSMEDHLKFSLAYWHTLCGTGVDIFGSGTMDKTFGGTDPCDIAKRRVYAAFELMEKLNINYFCFHDTDIVPTYDNLSETNKCLDIITNLIEDLMKTTKKKLLWGTANLFSHPRYMHGAATSCNADVFAYAAAQTKKAIEITVRLGGTGYVFWGGREGYDTLLNTDINFEQDNMARLLRLAVDYGRRIGFTGDFYIEPKPKEPCKHQYDFDALTTIEFLRKYNLINEFKLNIEANHATLAGHTFQHELRIARINQCFGSIDANQGDLLLGWDTDQFPSNVYESTMCMYEVLKAGGFKNGGLNFDAKSRRGSFTHEDVFHSLITGMDTFALGLIMAQKIIDDGRIDKFVSQRYDSYNSCIGKKIVNNNITLEELETYALAQNEIKNKSSSQEYLEGIINQIMFSKN